VVPLVKDGAVVGVLDCDSASLGRFAETEKDLLSRCADVVVEKLFS
jgi:putative methionine-R-sulfoxide reductase with GAF domain